MSLRKVDINYDYTCPNCNFVSKINRLNGYSFNCPSCKTKSEITQFLFDCPSCNYVLNVNIDDLLKSDLFTDCDNCTREIYVETIIKNWHLIGLEPKVI